MVEYRLFSYSLTPDSTKNTVNIGVNNDQDLEVIVSYLESKLDNDLVKKTFANSKSCCLTENDTIAFYAQSDTLANSVYKILQGDFKFKYRIFTPRSIDEKAAHFFTENNIPFDQYSFKKLRRISPKILVLLNDWSKEAKRIIYHCRHLGIATVCIQESIIDFGDSFKRMQHADYVFLQGVHTVFELNRSNCFITGNPRYEDYPSQDQTNKAKRVFINCNFTYGIFENIREKWLDDITNTLEEIDQEYFISKHPRDTGDLSKYKNVKDSSSSKVLEMLSGSRLVITRFSSLIHEALILGIPAIYYNPHGENMQYDFEFNNKFLHLCKNIEELKRAILIINETELDYREIENYITVHCKPANSKPSANILDILTSNDLKPGRMQFKNYLKMFIYLPFFVQGYDRLLKILKIR